MDNWKKIKTSFSKISDENVKKLKSWSEELIQKAKEGGGTLAEKSKEEFEILKLKYELYRMRSQMLETLGEVGSIYYESQKEDRNMDTNEELQLKTSIAAKIEGQCKEIEQKLEKMGKNPDVDDKDVVNHMELKSTPY